jgi:hypothetical protein
MQSFGRSTETPFFRDSKEIPHLTQFHQYPLSATQLISDQPGSLPFLSTILTVAPFDGYRHDRRQHPYRQGNDYNGVIANANNATIPTDLPDRFTRARARWMFSPTRIRNVRVTRAARPPWHHRAIAR